MRPTFVASLVLALVAPFAQAQSAFTYQGELKDNAQPASGLYDLRFKLFDAPTAGTQVGATVCVDNVRVTDGRFTAVVDFNDNLTNTFPRHLAIEVRRDTGLTCSNTTGFTQLSSRQAITSAPRAIYAERASALAAPDGSPSNAVVVDNDGKVGIGTATPGKKLTIDGDMEIGLSSGHYQHLRLGGGNSDGFLYGSFPRFADGIHLGYNYYADNAGVDRIIHPEGGTSRVSTYYGYVALATAPAGGGAPINRLTVDPNGNVRVNAPNGDFPVATGVESLRTIRGVVTAAGRIEVGTGFSVTKISTGHFIVGFTQPFTGLATVTTTADYTSYGNGAAVIALTSETTEGYTRIRVKNPDATYADAGFHFIAVGPR